MDICREVYSLFRKNMPYIVREEATARALIGGRENRIFTHEKDGVLAGACVVCKNAVYLLCVDEKYRGRGIGGKLLSQAEEYVRGEGYDSITAGVGEDYLMPGVPSGSMIYKEDLLPGDMYEEPDDRAWEFFRKRGYAHSWGNCNCFDMRQDLNVFSWDCGEIGGEINGVTYRWACEADIPAIGSCTDDAHSEFTKYYMDPALYNGEKSQRVLIAVKDGEVLGTLIVSRETEAANTGSVGCTAVRHSARGRHIAANMVLLGSKWLKQQGMTTGFLGYTYSGLDKLYGIAGYRICIFYAMAEKKLK